MKRFTKTILIVFFAGSAFSVFGYYFWCRPKFIRHTLLLNRSITSFEESQKLRASALSLKKFIVAHHYNSRICFLVDMKIHSGKDRFFVYDQLNDSILISGLVAHGSCDNSFQINAGFSNRINSGCSCAGKFKIGGSYIGRFGLAYKLYGLDSSNSNTYRRNIVLHSYGCVPEQEAYPLPICNSRGCAMVSPGFLQKLKSYIENSTNPILLNIGN